MMSPTLPENATDEVKFLKHLSKKIDKFESKTGLHFEQVLEQGGKQLEELERMAAAASLEVDKQTAHRKMITEEIDAQKEKAADDKMKAAAAEYAAEKAALVAARKEKAEREKLDEDKEKALKVHLEKALEKNRSEVRNDMRNFSRDNIGVFAGKVDETFKKSEDVELDRAYEDGHMDGVTDQKALEIATKKANLEKRFAGTKVKELTANLENNSGQSAAATSTAPVIAAPRRSTRNSRPARE